MSNGKYFNLAHFIKELLSIKRFRYPTQHFSCKVNKIFNSCNNWRQLVSATIASHWNILRLFMMCIVPAVVIRFTAATEEATSERSTGATTSRSLSCSSIGRSGWRAITVSLATAGWAMNFRLVCMGLSAARLLG